MTPYHRGELALGRRYNRVKKAQAGAPAGNRNAKKQLGQIDPIVFSENPVTTADRLAAEYGISPATVKRAGKGTVKTATVAQLDPRFTAERLAAIAAQAKARMLATLKQNTGTAVPNLAPREEGKTRDAVAELAGVSHSTIAKVKSIQVNPAHSPVTVTDGSLLDGIGPAIRFSS